MMARAFTPKVLTASDLFEGDVVYLARGGNWTRNLADALLIESESSATAILSGAEAGNGRLVGAYLADAEAGPDGRPRPTHYREEIRAKGPSNYRHGKQSGG